MSLPAQRSLNAVVSQGFSPVSQRSGLSAQRSLSAAVLSTAQALHALHLLHHLAGLLKLLEEAVHFHDGCS